MTTLETLYRMRNKALHRYTLTLAKKKRVDEEYAFQVEELKMLEVLIGEAKDKKQLEALPIIG